MKFQTAVLAWLSISSVMFGQNVSSSVKGEVMDPSGAALAGATCTLTNQATSQSVSVKSFGDGAFTFPTVTAGVYELKIESPGFKTFSLRDITVTAGELRTLGRLTLDIGELKDTVSVTAEAASLQLASAERSGLISGTQLNDIAIKGRDLFAFLSTIPGIINTNGGGLDTTDPAAMGGISINGNRTGSKNVTVDGITDLDTGNNTSLQFEPNMDSVGEVKVLTNNYQAEYGRMGGGQIMVITKSGTQSFHGTAYDYYRNQWMNANNFFNNRSGVARPNYRYRISGYSIGGPVYIPGKLNAGKDKVFFFFSEEFTGFWQTRVCPW